MELNAEPVEQHRWLARLVGEWTVVGECTPGPDQEPMKSEGTESVSTLGDLWVLIAGRMPMPDGEEGRTLITLGYDTKREKFVGTFIGSMMDMMWYYEGELDKEERILTLSADGPKMHGKGTGKYRDIIEWVSEDHRIFRGQLQDDDGNWVEFMTSDVRRKA